MDNINMLLYKYRNCDKTLEEYRTRINPPGFPGTIKIGEFFEYKIVTHNCNPNDCENWDGKQQYGICDIIGFKTL